MKDENIIEPKRNFRKEIEDYFNRISNGIVPEELLNEIVEAVTKKIYSDYLRFWEQYPKSRKRYSKLKLEDIKHPFVFYLITDLLKKKNVTEYRSFSKALFEMNDAELDDYEKRKYLYETK